MKLDFSQQSLAKYSNTKFNDNLSGGSRVAQCGRKDGQTGRPTGRHETANDGKEEGQLDATITVY